MNLAISAVVLAAALNAAPPPYPPPLFAAVDEAMKYSAGTVSSVDAQNATLTVTTAAGLVTFKTDKAQVVGADKQPRASMAGVAPGQKVNIYFHLGDGAIANEIDLLAT